MQAHISFTTRVSDLFQVHEDGEVLIPANHGQCMHG